MDAAYPHGTLGFVCQLAEQFQQSGQQACLLAESADMAHSLDQQLWAMDGSAFVPHEIWHDNPNQESGTTLLLGWDEPPVQQHEILINLQQDVPLCFSRFDRLVEIVDASKPEPGRERYQFYRDRGYPLETRKISS